MISDLLIIMLYGSFSFILGLLIGSMNHNHPNAVEKNLDNLIPEPLRDYLSLQPKKIESDLTPGVYARPTAKDLALLDEDPKKQEAKEEMKKSLDEIPDLRKAREFVESMKK